MKSVFAILFLVASGWPAPGLAQSCSTIKNLRDRKVCGSAVAATPLTSRETGYGSVSGLLAFRSFTDLRRPENGGHVTLIAAPIDHSLAILPPQYQNRASIELGFGGFLGAEADALGNYSINHVPEGHYLAIAFSRNVTMVTGAVEESCDKTANHLLHVSGNHLTITCKFIDVYKGESIKFDAEFIQEAL